MKKIKIWGISVLLVAFISSCSVIKPIPVNTNTETIYNYIDTLIIRDSTVLIPKYVVKDVVPDYDTLKLATDLAEAQSWVDTSTHTLKGQIQNKNEQQTKYIYRDRIVYRDSIQIQEKEIPVPYEVIQYKVPKWCWWNLAYSILLTIGVVLYILRRLKII